MLIHDFTYCTIPSPPSSCRVVSPKINDDFQGFAWDVAREIPYGVLYSGVSTYVQSTWLVRHSGFHVSHVKGTAFRDEAPTVVG